MDDIRNSFYVKVVGSRYMMFNSGYSKHIYLFPNKTKYEYSACYDVGGKYCQRGLQLNTFKPNFACNNLLYYLATSLEQF